jgi:hypothetical protein
LLFFVTGGQIEAEQQGNHRRFLDFRALNHL